MPNNFAPGDFYVYDSDFGLIFGVILSDRGNVRECRAFSESCPDGEIGSVDIRWAVKASARSFAYRMTAMHRKLAEATA